jgi:hypothetical protein
MGVKIGCMVYLRLPAMLAACDQQARKNLHEAPDVGVSLDGLLVLFMN